MKRAGGWMIWIGLLIAAAPVLSVILASAIAGMGGCSVDEGSAAPCLVAGRDIEPMLYSMFVAGWLFLLTAPVGLGLVIVGAAFRIVARRRGKAGG